jgi:NAD(P)-dependent dehydrogenase (short-subunit alcohol dehydrogenase family)
MKEFKDRVAVVTGAASGIGRGLAKRFASEGMHVVLADIETEPLEQTRRELEGAGASVFAVCTDVSNPEALSALAHRTLDRFGGVHVVCNNAGVGTGGLSWEEPYEDWQWVVGVNLWGVINGVRAFVPLMLEGSQEGHIVNTASVAGLMAGAGSASYTATKFGIVGFSEALHYELLMASQGRLGVSVLCPGATDTRIIDAGRNRPGGAPPAPVPGTMEAAGLNMARQILAAGQSPAHVAEKVLDAIINQHFYVLSHPEHNGIIAKRAEAMLSGAPPPAIGMA